MLPIFALAQILVQAQSFALPLGIDRGVQGGREGAALDHHKRAALPQLEKRRRSVIFVCGAEQLL